jgi:F-type H+-transporting ATPase subunit epsilon
MSAKTFTLNVAKVSEQLFHGDAVSVTLPGSEGQMTILAHHAPLISLLKEGTVTIQTTEGSQEINISKGVLEVSNNQVTVLV